MSDVQSGKLAARNEGTGKLRIFYDGECPLCMREINWLKQRTHSAEVAYEDISRSDFDFVALGISHQTLMAEIHAQLPDGRFVVGMDVFRSLYRAASLGWLMVPTTWPGIRWLADRAYAWFARNRLRLTGRRDCEGHCELPGLETGTREST